MTTKAAQRSNRAKALKPWEGVGLASIALVANYLEISVSKLYELISDGRFGPSSSKLGGSVRYLQEEVVTWVDAGMPRKEAWLKHWEQIKAERIPKARKH